MSRYVKPAKGPERAFHEKAFARSTLAHWDEVWRRLSPESRRAYLEVVKGPVNVQVPGRAQPSHTEDKIGKAAAAELTAAGMIEPAPPAKKSPEPRYSPTMPPYDFALRLRGLVRFDLLGDGGELRFPAYLDWIAGLYAFRAVAATVLNKSKSGHGLSYLIEPQVVMTNRRWPEWVAKALGGRGPEKVLEAILGASGPVSSAEVASMVKGMDAVSVRLALNDLVGHGALVEAVDPKTLDVVVDLLPSVRLAIEEARRPWSRASLEACESPKEVAQVGPLYLDDLRAVLLEVASEPPRVRQDGALFAKEEDRFIATLGPVPAWYATEFALPEESRMTRAFLRASYLDLVKESTKGKESRIELTDKGNKWLVGSVEAQAARLFGLYQAMPGSKYDDHDDVPDGTVVAAESVGRTWGGYGYDYGYGKNDARFLGSNVTVAIGKKPRTSYGYFEPKDSDVKALRESFASGLKTLAVGTYYRMESLVRRFGEGPANVLLCGQPEGEVSVAVGGRVLSDLDDQHDRLAALAWRGLIAGRLVPLGCLEAALDHDGKVCLARTPFLGAYFGFESLKEGATAGPSAAETRVVVQPDFSVLVIGLNPAPVAELAPFCERVTRGGAPGAQTLKLTRESIIKAVARGMTVAEMTARLERLTSHPLPPNVLKEVKQWGGWARKVEAATIFVIRCPDRETADRVAGVLKKAERISDALVAIDPDNFTKTDRDRLQAQGIILEGRFAKETAAPKKKAARSRRW